MRNQMFLISAILLLSACVPGRRFQEVQTEAMNCAREKKELSAKFDDVSAQLTECKARQENLSTSLDKLQRDTTLLGSTLRRVTGQYDKINELNEQLMKKQASLMSNSENEKKDLLENLLVMQKDLQEQQTRLTTLEKELNDKSTTLVDREARVKELEQMLASKDAAVRELKDKVSNAPLNFKDKGLTVVEKNGRVYVSLEAKLLFASGSTAVSAEGSSALVKLAQAIQNESDISILVEGHTDTDKIIGNSAPYKDNWDLSVLRATSVVRIMQENSSLDPKQLTAAGRGEYLPVDPADKAKNRRIEIILAPDLGELFKLINEE